MSEYHKNYYLTNKERLLAYSKDYYQRNKEAIKLKQKERALKNTNAVVSGNPQTVPHEQGTVAQVQGRSGFGVSEE